VELSVPLKGFYKRVGWISKYHLLYRGTLNYIVMNTAFAPVAFLKPEEEDKIVEALEELRIQYNLRQWRVCSLICESLADKFRTIANDENK